MAGPFWVAGTVGLSLALLCGTVLVGLLTEGLRRRDSSRAELASLWLGVKEGVALSDVVARLGPPDESDPDFDRIPACADPCDVGCSSFHTCVRRHTWYSSQSEDTAETYLACTDEAGVVRRVSTGMSFRLRWDSGTGDLEGFVLGQALLVLLGVPVAVTLRLWHRRHPLAAEASLGRCPSPPRGQV